MMLQSKTGVCERGRRNPLPGGSGHTSWLTWSTPQGWNDASAGLLGVSLQASWDSPEMRGITTPDTQKSGQEGEGEAIWKEEAS